MTLILRPPGRGNWSPITVTFEGARAQALALFVRPGLFMTIGPDLFRICEVRP